jgi:hypothetical protein
VQSEFDIALAEEVRRGEVILPITLDRAMMTASSELAGNLRNRHVLEFRTRGQSGNYYDSLRKLLARLEVPP